MTPPSSQAYGATLLDDEGAAGADPANFFRCPDFLAAEGVTHTLEIASGTGIAARMPVIVRPIEGTDRRDAISPYGYPGGSEPAQPPPDPGEVDWSGTGLVSLFVRDRIDGPACLSGGTERARVHIADPAQPSGIRKRLREQIRRNERRGWTVATDRGPETPPERRAAFQRAYTETMERTSAAPRYLFGGEYFERVLASERSRLLVAEREGEPLAGAIAVESDGYLHYFLGGTAAGALGDSPMKNLFAAMIALAAEAPMPLHLGGGVRPGDSLDDFKRGFANASAAFLTHEVVCDPRAYGELSERAGARTEGFFPAYRAGG